MKAWIIKLLADASGAPCPVRALFLIGFLCGLAFQGVAVLRGAPFSMVTYGAGLAAYLAGGGAGIGAKTWASSPKS